MESQDLAEVSAQAGPYNSRQLDLPTAVVVRRTVLTRLENGYTAPARGAAPELVVFWVAWPLASGNRLQLPSDT